MKVQEESFESYLRSEVEIAGNRYDQAVEKVFTVLGESHDQPGPDLVFAVQALSENLRLYSGAMRRMACFAARPHPAQAKAFAAAAR